MSVSPILRFVYVLILLFLCVAATQAFSSFEETGGDIHGQITREALAQIICEGNLKLIIEANESQDKPNSEGSKETRRHFANDNFAGSVAYIDREKKRALNYAQEADQDPESRMLALKHFGLMLHCAQDFYSRTNYIEVQIKDLAKRNNPFSIPLIDWSCLPGKYTQAAESKVTYFAIARELAIKETERQWHLFEALIRVRCKTRAASIIAALREASSSNANVTTYY